MGIFSWLRRKKKESLPLEPIEAAGVTERATRAVISGTEPVTMENVRAKLELMMTRLDSLSTQYAAMNERLKNIERLVTEIRSFCK